MPYRIREAAAVVRRIFQSVLAGETIASIAKELRAEKIPILSEHWKRAGEPVRTAKYADPYAWSATTILAVIQRVSWYVRHNEKEFTERVREASDQNQEKTVKLERRQAENRPVYPACETLYGFLRAYNAHL